MKASYFVHDIGDPAVKRRVISLVNIGVDVTVAGFSRSPAVPLNPDIAKVIDLGPTYDGKLTHRVWKVSNTLFKSSVLKKCAADADILIARNLECLALLWRSLRWSKSNVYRVYEVLDIHQALLGSSLSAKVLRTAEKRLMRNVDRIITSSPAFITEYFQTYQNVDSDKISLVENRIVFPQRMPNAVKSNKDQIAPAGSARQSTGKPWQIGWFGVIRCRKSLVVLDHLAKHMDGLVNVVIRGKVAHDVIPDFETIVSANPYLSFYGPYQYPNDLQKIYEEIDFVWCIDYFEAGANSEWLLPNRLYEGGAFNTPHIARAGVEAAHWLKRQRLGYILDEPIGDSLHQFFHCITPTEVDEMRTAYRAKNRSLWIDDGSGVQLFIGPNKYNDDCGSGGGLMHIQGANRGSAQKA
ncbi:MAG: glycosyl transferase family 1 [Pseudomonadota bacterium]